MLHLHPLAVWREEGTTLSKGGIGPTRRERPLEELSPGRQPVMSSTLLLLASSWARPPPPIPSPGEQSQDTKPRQTFQNRHLKTRTSQPRRPSLKELDLQCLNGLSPTSAVPLLLNTLLLFPPPFQVKVEMEQLDFISPDAYVNPDQESMNCGF